MCLSIETYTAAVFYSSCITSTGLFAMSFTSLEADVSSVVGEVTLLLAITIRSISISSDNSRGESVS